MKKAILLSVLAVASVAVVAKPKDKKAENPNKPVFTVVKENPITSVKNQSRSGTCWNYSTLSFFEAEILKATGKTTDLCEMFVCNKDYMERAINRVRMHGDAQFAQGGSAYDVLAVIQNHGICPDDAMPFPGTLYGDSLNNFNQFFEIMDPVVEAVSKSKARTLNPAWKKAFQGILDAYLGVCPEKFTVDGKEYTPKSYAASLGLDWSDYETFTSYTHHPFYSAFPVEVQDNWRMPASYNVPIDELQALIDNAIENGYTVAWGGDVSGGGFSRDGVALLVDEGASADLTGSDMAHWLKLSPKERQDKIKELGVNVKEATPTQEKRQEEFDNWTLTDDHGMLIYGIAKDQTGREYYMVKNSWGESSGYNGIWYMSKAYIIQNTMDVMVNKKAVPAEILKKCGL